MSIKTWSDLDITSADFEALWNMPYGAFTARVKKIKKTRESFFPRTKFKIKVIHEGTLNISARTEADAIAHVKSMQNPAMHYMTYEVKYEVTKAYV